MRRKIITVTVVLLATVLSFFLFKKPVNEVEAEYDVCSYRRLLSFYEAEGGYSAPTAKCISQQAGRVQNVMVAVGERVEEDQVIVLLDDEEYVKAIEKLHNTLQEAEQAAKTADAELRRQKSIYYTMLAQYGSADYDEYTAAVEQYISALDEQMSQVNAELSASKAELEAQIEQYTKLAEACVIKAPCGGIISSVNIAENEFCSAAYPVATVANTEKAYFAMTVSGEDTQRIKACTEALIEYDGEVFNAEIVSVSPLAQAEGVWNEVRVKADELPANMLLGEKASIKIPVEDAGTVLTVPLSALNMDKNGHYVYKADGNKAGKVYVEIGQIGFDRAEIMSGISEGDKVITYSSQKPVADGGDND